MLVRATHRDSQVEFGIIDSERLDFWREAGWTPIEPVPPDPPPTPGMENLVDYEREAEREQARIEGATRQRAAQQAKDAARALRQ